MNIATPVRTLIVIAVLSVASTQSAQAVGHIADLADRLECQSQTLINEIRSHYRHTRQYGPLLSDAYQVRGLTRHIHALTHHHGNLFLIPNAVDRLDRLFHHLEELLALADRCPHNGPHYGHSGHVLRHLQCMEDTLYRLRVHLNRLNRPPCGFDRHDPRSMYRLNANRFNNGVNRFDNSANRFGNSANRFGNNINRFDDNTIRFSNGRLSFRFGF